MTAARPSERCAAITRALAEPLAGTAPTARRWLCLESPDPWPRDITRHPDPAVSAFLARAATAGFRSLLVRRPLPGSTRRVLLADTAPGSTATTALPFHHVADLAEIPLPEPVRPLPGEPLTAPQLLVCTHDQRDPCCGQDGRSLVGALASTDALECSHLGGHRFAPTALVLPTGYLYGHLDLATATAARTAATAGEVATDRCRGRSTWSANGQVAELAVRAATGLLAADALTVQDDSGDTVHIRATTGASWAVDIEHVESDIARPASCGARPTLMVPLRAAAVRALPPQPVP